MKHISKIFLVICPLIFIEAGCDENPPDIQIDQVVGVWIESKPELYDVVSDTILLKTNGKVGKHFLFQDWNYEYNNDSLIFF